MKILISGASGLIGNALISLLQQQGHTLNRLVRSSPQGSQQFLWDPAKHEIDPAALEGIDAVIHLSGENVASGRWTKNKKQKILDSRIQSTQLLTQAITQLKTPPKHFLCASAIGFYGDRGQEVMSEDNSAGKGFLSDVCQTWEQECLPLKQIGLRVVNLRFGVVLDPAGGALAKMLTPFKMGVGAQIGNGQQIISWITLKDTVRAIAFLLEHESAEGPVNIVAPGAISNAVYTDALANALGKSTTFPIPKFAAKVAFGEMAEVILLNSTHAQPKRLQEWGFEFEHADIDTAFKSIL